MNHAGKSRRIAFVVVAVSSLAGPMTRADVVTDWNVKAGEIVVEARLAAPPSNRVLAIVQTAVYEAGHGQTDRRGGRKLTAHRR